MISTGSGRPVQLDLTIALAKALIAHPTIGPHIAALLLTRQSYLEYRLALSGKPAAICANQIHTAYHVMQVLNTVRNAPIGPGADDQF